MMLRQQTTANSHSAIPDSIVDDQDLTFGLGTYAEPQEAAAQPAVSTSLMEAPYPLIHGGALIGISNDVRSVLEYLRYWLAQPRYREHCHILFAPDGPGLRIPGKLTVYRAHSRAQIPGELRIGPTAELDSVDETWIVLRPRIHGGAFASLIYGPPLRRFAAELQQSMDRARTTTHPQELSWR